MSKSSIRHPRAVRCADQSALANPPLTITVSMIYLLVNFFFPGLS